ncbi:hypothetical protein [Clostridium beijerinckii]|uniref:hypothetical protein n=1 Tax=Clostridium beijerinckii TaxID=1520 RepID=UPI00047CCB7D|nr:hypothetical protein [Clostridium beijerinckii]
MKAEQMGLMKVIQFPQNKLKEKEIREKSEKMEVAFEILNYLIKNGCDFHILLNAKYVEVLSSYVPKNSKYAMLTSNLDEAEKIRIYGKEVCFYPIEGNELK